MHYEIFVRSFADSNGDGIGDLNGVTNNLDYLKDLGVSAIWLMPISPSPTYHKYDVTDYYGIDPEYGTMDDFRRLIAEAHRRGIAVIIDLVLHHTSIRHPWFQEVGQRAGQSIPEVLQLAAPRRNKSPQTGHPRHHRRLRRTKPLAFGAKGHPAPSSTTVCSGAACPT